MNKDVTKIQIQFNNANANSSTVLQVNETGFQLQPTTEPITVKTRVLSTTTMGTLRKGGERHNNKLQPTTEPITVKTRVLSTTTMGTLRKGGERPTSGDKLHSKGVFMATAAVIKQQRSVVEMGVAGSIYLWFFFIKGNVFLAKDVYLSF